MPQAGRAKPVMSHQHPILETRDLSVTFPTKGGKQLKAVSGVSIQIQRGEVFGLVGESGSGKTTLGRAILGLVPVSSGTVSFDGSGVQAMTSKELRSFRTRVQVVFQDPYGSLNPRMSVESILKEAILLVDPPNQADARISELLELVGLSANSRSKYPHEFSGGQRQRICIARALAVRPEFLVADEPVAALDVSVQAQIVNLLQDLQRDLGLTMLFIAHDLAVVRHISDRIGVMYLGRLQEVGTAEDIIDAAAHPYTRALLSAVPNPDPKAQTARQVLSGELPSAMSPPSGCVFRTRCPHADEACASTVPELREFRPGQFAACLKV